jgi:hypothetical protein
MLEKQILSVVKYRIMNTLICGGGDGDGDGDTEVEDLLF